MLSSVHGQLLNISMLAKSLELSPPAISNYLDILEGALLIRRLQPYFVNIRKRLVRVRNCMSGIPGCCIAWQG
jgi:predicted AAA+ superfamily ATPase